MPLFARRIEADLFRAAFPLSTARGGASAGARLDFRVTANADRSLTLEFEHVGGAPERLRVTLDG